MKRWGGTVNGGIAVKRTGLNRSTIKTKLYKTWSFTSQDRFFTINKWDFTIIHHGGPWVLHGEMLQKNPPTLVLLRRNALAPQKTQPGTKLEMPSLLVNPLLFCGITHLCCFHIWHDGTNCLCLVSIYLSIDRSFYLSIFLFSYTSIFLPVFTLCFFSICLSIYSSIYLSILSYLILSSLIYLILSIYLSIDLSIDLSI